MSRSYDGVNDRLQVSAAVFDATAIETTTVAIATLVKRGRTSAASDEFLACGGVANAISHYCAVLINPSNQVVCRTRTTSNAEAIDTTHTITDTTTWHLIFAVYKGIANRAIYVDNNAAATNATSRDPSTATDFFCLGATPESGIGSEFQGLQGDTAVWTGLSKTDAQWDAMRDALWNGGAFVDFSTVESANQVALWTLRTNASPEVNAKNPGTFDLTVTGATFSTDNPFTLGTNVNATKQSIAITPRTATIQKNKNLSATKQSIVITPRTAVKKLSRNIVASLQSMSQIERTATIQLGSDVAINATTKALSQVEQAATIRLAKAVTATKQSMAHSEATQNVQLVSFDPRTLLSLLRSDENPFLRM